MLHTVINVMSIHEQYIFSRYCHISSIEVIWRVNYQGIIIQLICIVNKGDKRQWVKSIHQSIINDGVTMQGQVCKLATAGLLNFDWPRSQTGHKYLCSLDQ